MQVTLRGNQQLDLISVDSPAIKQLQLDTLPHDPVRLRLQSKSTTREELSIRQTILRTAVGRNTRHEQVLAKIQGGDNFRVDIPSTAREVSVEALIDGQVEAGATRTEFADRDTAGRQTQSRRRFARLDCRHHAIRICRDRADVKAARRSGQSVLANRYPAGRSRCLGFADSWSIDDMEV